MVFVSHLMSLITPWSRIEITSLPAPVGISCAIPKSITTIARPSTVMATFSALKLPWQIPYRRGGERTHESRLERYIRAYGRWGTNKTKQKKRT